MLDEQKKKILQMLYEKHSISLHAPDKEDLVHLIGKPWQEIQRDVAYLEEKGYVATTKREIRTRIFYTFRITTKGIDFVESGANEPGEIPGNPNKLRRQIDVFLSSPGDVGEERQIVKRIIDRFNRMLHIADRYVIKLLLYEESSPAEVGRPPQTIIDSHMKNAGSSDLFICILWHRMGTPVIDAETGERFQSGTEYEFLDAYRNNQKQGKPYILLYQSKKPLPPEVDSDQLHSVLTFFKRFEGEHAELKGLYKTYRSNQEFEDTLFHDIDKVLSKNL